MMSRAILLSDKGPWQTDLVGASGAAPIESGARSGEPRAAPADQCPAANGAEEAFPQQRRPIDICLPLYAVPRCSERPGNCQAGDDHSLAPLGVQGLLALAIEDPRRTTEGAA